MVRASDGKKFKSMSYRGAADGAVLIIIKGKKSKNTKQKLLVCKASSQRSGGALCTAVFLIKIGFIIKTLSINQENY